MIPKFKRILRKDIKARINTDLGIICEHYNEDSSKVEIKIRYKEEWLKHTSGSCIIWRRRINIAIPDSVFFALVDEGVNEIRRTLTHEAIHLFEDLRHNYQGYKLGYYSDCERDIYTPQIVSKIFGVI